MQGESLDKLWHIFTKTRCGIAEAAKRVSHLLFFPTPFGLSDGDFDADIPRLKSLSPKLGLHRNYSSDPEKKSQAPER
jgi:hypothetical protein